MNTLDNQRDQNKPLLEQLVNVSRTAVPDDALAAAGRIFRHNFLMALAGRSVETPGVSEELWPPGLPQNNSATRLIDGAIVPAERAVFSNSLLMGARAQHDESPGAVSHFGSTVIPALLAIAEQRQLSGAEILRGLSIGYEIGDRVGRALVEGTTKRGFRPTGVFGPIASAAASASLMRLDQKAWTSALALACNMSAGLTETWRAGTDEWKYQTALAARSGYTAATLASSGVNGSSYTLEAPNGLIRAYTGCDVDISVGRNITWAVQTVNLKLYPICVFNQAAVQQVVELWNRASTILNDDSADVEQIEIRMNPANLSYPGVNVLHPAPTRAARLMSLPFCASVAATQGTVDMASLETEVSSDHDRLLKAVSLIPDDSILSHHAQVRLRVSGKDFKSPKALPLQMDEHRSLGVYRSLQPETQMSNTRLSKVLATLNSFQSTPNIIELLDLIKRAPNS